MDLNEVFFHFDWKKRCRLYIFSFSMNWLSRKKDCRLLRHGQSRIPAGRGWLTQENHTDWEGTKSRHPVAANLMDWRFWKCGWSRGRGSSAPVGSSHQLSHGAINEEAAMFLMVEESGCFLPSHHLSNALQHTQWRHRLQWQETVPNTLAWRHQPVGNLSKCLPERYEILATEVFQGLDKFETQWFLNLISQPVPEPVSLQVSAIFLRVSEKMEWRITFWCHCSRPVTISEMIVSASTHICNWLPKPYDSLSQLMWWNIGVKSLSMRRSQVHLLFTSLPAPFSLSGANCPPRAHYGNQPECMYRNQSRWEPPRELWHYKVCL